MGIALSPLFNPDGAQIDANGAPRSGAKLFTYVAGTIGTKVTTFKDSLGAASHTNPIILDANGLAPAAIWLTTGAAVKFVLAPSTDTDPPTSPILTIDAISAVNDLVATASTEWTSSGLTPTYVSATSFTVPGDQTTALEVNRRIKATVTAGTVYGTIITSVFTSLTTVGVLLDSGALDSGLSVFSYGILGTSNPSLPLVSNNQQCGRLIYVSPTQIRFDPQNGNTIWVFTGAFWRLRRIPSAGVTAANTSIYIDGTSGQNLVASTQYFVYLWDNAGVLTMDFSVTAPAVDASSGLKIKTGAATRLLIGMVRTNSATPGAFQLSPLVISWYSRRGIPSLGASLSGSAQSNSTTLVELQSAARVFFLAWAETAIQAQFTGFSYMDGVSRSATTSITLDGTTTAISNVIQATSYAASAQDNASGTGYFTTTDGYHYVTLTVKVDTGLGTWNGSLHVLAQG